jgi:hypothetical protein
LSGLATSPQRLAVPPNLRALCALPRIDYEDAFALEVAAARQRTPAQWARVSLGDAPPNIGTSLWSAFSALGVLPQARDRTADQVVSGWEFRRTTEEFALLGGDARIGLSAELLFHVRPQGVLWATFVQLKNPLARAAWAGLTPIHRRVVPQLLRRAAAAARSA